ncbi:uncharacterized protein (DUF1810 family) [Pseudorhizobium tarimense]|uniref:Uncharacterized protein (DUF1810 family) n=1 Tax=Pseudorhizobium tarimense TaxID=1079109 RepID=A0ABV2H7Y8_9HYPH|nr:DUF1810 domain-containing protein [Pseudorhizobium tarimense]MCJ8519615.1 DUF1810 domain-containing protein [Pseudorhizobium tarimense]
MATPKTFDLQRFVDAQDPVYEHVLAELEAGAKRSHWMWFVFPQMKGLGFSSMAKRFAISSQDEANAYLDHPLLGERLIECTALMLQHMGKTAYEILGSPDDMKFRSCMTLFAAVSERGSPFERALDSFYHGERDRKTIALLRP